MFLLSWTESAGLSTSTGPIMCSTYDSLFYLSNLLWCSIAYFPRCSKERFLVNMGYEYLKPSPLAVVNMGYECLKLSPLAVVNMGYECLKRSPLAVVNMGYECLKLSPLAVVNMRYECLKLSPLAVVMDHIFAIRSQVDRVLRNLHCHLTHHFHTAFTNCTNWRLCSKVRCHPLFYSFSIQNFPWSWMQVNVEFDKLIAVIK